MLFIIFAFYFAVSLAQRPSNASTCDYYAQALYGANNSQTQYDLVQHIVSLAFAGAPPGTTNSNASAVTGILNPGVFLYQGANLSVDLQPWFNGSIDSTNLNNQAVGIDWLDDGGLDPLYAYLNGTTETVQLTNTTNQYRLFTHFYQAFSHIFGCSDPPSPPPSSSTTPSNLAYIHKYMDLNYTDLGHFIDQFAKSTTTYGFSPGDTQTLSNDLNSDYNVRCAPPVTLNPKQGQVLLSLCQDPTCPLAFPNADCAAYVNLSASGVPGAASSGSPSATPTEFKFSTISASATSSPSPSSSTTSSSSSSSPLSPGAIAGIAIGGAAVLLFFLVAIIFLLRKRRSPPPPQQQQPFTPAPSSMYGGTTSYGGTNSIPGFPGEQPPGEQKFASFTSQTGSPEMMSPMWPQTHQGQGGEVGQDVAEMDSSQRGSGGGGGEGVLGRSWCGAVAVGDGVGS